MSKSVPDDVLKVRESAELLFDRESVDRAVDQLAVRLSLALVEAHPVVICVMTGGLILTADLLKRFHFPLEVDYVHATRYDGDLVGGELRMRTTPATDVTGRTVLVVDDIFDHGTTLRAVQRALDRLGVASQRTAVLVVKRRKRGRRGPRVDVSGLVVDDVYVFGSGMDYRGHWRELGGVYALAVERR